MARKYRISGLEIERIPSDDMNERRQWRAEEESLINQWIEESAARVYLHEKSSLSFKKYDHIVTLPIMIITAATGSANVSMAFSQQPSWISNLVTGIFGVGSAVLTAISHYYKFSEMAESHKQTANAWNKMRASMLVQLALPFEERAECRTFMDSIREEMDRLNQTSPSIPEAFITEFQNNQDRVYQAIPDI